MLPDEAEMRQGKNGGRRVGTEASSVRRVVTRERAARSRVARQFARVGRILLSSTLRIPIRAGTAYPPQGGFAGPPFGVLTGGARGSQKAKRKRQKGPIGSGRLCR